MDNEKVNSILSSYGIKPSKKVDPNIVVVDGQSYKRGSAELIAKYSQQATQASAESKKANSVMELIKGTTSASGLLKGTGEVAASIGNFLAEGVLSAGEAVPRLLNEKLSTTIVPPTKIPGLGALGPVQSIQSKILAANLQKEKVNIGSDLGQAAFQAFMDEPLGLALKPVFVVGGLVVRKFFQKDIETAIKNIAKSDNPEVITDNLKKVFTGSEADYKAAADKLVGVTDPVEVNKIIQAMAIKNMPASVAAGKPVAEEVPETFKFSRGEGGGPASGANMFGKGYYVSEQGDAIAKQFSKSGKITQGEYKAKPSEILNIRNQQEYEALVKEAQTKHFNLPQDEMIPALALSKKYKVIKGDPSLDELAGTNILDQSVIVQPVKISDPVAASLFKELKGNKAGKNDATFSTNAGTKRAINGSQQFDPEDAIKSGLYKREQIFQKNGNLTPEAAEGYIRDVATKLARHDAQVDSKLMEEFLSQVDSNSVKLVNNQPVGLIKLANELLDKAAASKVVTKKDIFTSVAKLGTKEGMPTRSIAEISKRITSNESKVMEDFLDYTRLGKKTNPELEIKARKIFEEMGGDPNLPNGRIAAFFQKVIEFDSKAERTVLAGAEKVTAKAENPKELAQLRKSIGFERHTKDISSATVSRIRHALDIGTNPTKAELNAILTELKKLKPGDSFLTEKQLVGLSDFVEKGGFTKNPLLITKREMQTVYKEKEEIMNGVITRRISNNFFPTVNVKEGHPIITHIVDRADMELRGTNKIIKGLTTELDDLMTAAQKSRPQGLLKNQTGEAIFKRLSGQDVKLTAQEEKVADYLKKYFAQAKKDLKLERYRQNYVTHLDAKFAENVGKYGIFKAISMQVGKFGLEKNANIPVDLMVNLDNIIGSQKFFRFALERKGGIEPTTNIRRIFKEYSSLVETKKALDKILPEAQAAQQLLIADKSALWMKSFLQNLKGRALDYKFRSGKMGWAAKTGDRVVDLGYLRLLALNPFSAVKNIVGGEVNSFVFQPVTKFLLGKKRLFANPVKSYKIISDLGLLDGSYVDIARSDMISKGKHVANTLAYGLMQGAEYEIRGSYLLGQLTKNEFQTGKLSAERYREILNGIAKTQGIYTKVDSPQFVQTVAGRAVVQFGRWQITNAMLVRDVVKGMKKEIAAGSYAGENTRRLMKILATTGLGMYYAYQFAQAGNKKAKQVAETAAQLVQTIMSIGDGQLVYNALSNNPSLQTLGAITYSMQELASYITGGFVPEPQSVKFQQGVEDMYVAGLNTLGLQDSSSKAKSAATVKGILSSYGISSGGGGKQDNATINKILSGYGIK